jgi:hypothetical protein
MQFPPEVQKLLEDASRPRRTAGIRPAFTCDLFGAPWNEFVETWSPKVYTFIGNALGPYDVEPLPNIGLVPDGAHSAGATASFDPSSGQVSLASSVEGKPGQTLEKLTHEMLHASLSRFPEGDPFYEEGQVDFSTWVLAHAPIWGSYRNDMISAAAYNIRVRRDRALKDLSDYDRKRWAGGLYASLTYGPYIIARLRHRKAEGNYTWSSA